MQVTITTTTVITIDADTDFVCAECGTADADTYVVTTLDPTDPTTRTEVCTACHTALSQSGPIGIIERIHSRR